jgi:tyrosyl-tRNA synthetase
MLATMPPSALSEDLQFRGLVQQVSDDSLLERLDREHLTAYIGFDPTADSLTVGHLLMICNLRRLQEAGHRPIALAGGGTGLIGDPGGRDTERPLMTRETLEENLVAIRAQLARYLDFGESAGDAQALLLDNGDWLCSIPVMDFLRDVGKHFTVNSMLAKESVKSRLDRPEQGISYTEFSYMLLQAYDFLHLFDAHGCTLQMGGSDQWGNIVAGVDLIRRTRGATTYALTTPLFLNPDGTKMGKSTGPAVWLDPARTSPYALYQYFVRSEDALVGERLRRLTFLDHETIAQLDAEVVTRPDRRVAQQALARAITTFVHGEEETERAERAAAALYSEDVVALDEDLLLAAFAEAPSSDLPRSRLDGPGLDLVEALAESDLVPSRSAARTTVAQGGAYVNNRRRGEGEPVTREDLIHDRYVVLRRGKQHHHLLRFA